MVEKIIEFSAKNRFIVFLLVFALATGGLWALKNTPIDALPDISDTQVIIYTPWMGRSPDLVEDQITYPIVTALLSAPNVTVVRGFSDFGFSYVYVLFKDGTDIYWARSRVLEYMNQLAGRLPEGVAPRLGPDATAVGWVFQYALVDESGSHSLAELRSLQDWYLRYWLSALDGVAEVASVGGFVRQYQINLDPAKVLAYKLSLAEIIERVRMNNLDVGGRVVEFSGVEYMIRGRGYIKSVADIEQIAVGVSGKGTPVLLRDVARVALGPDMRRGLVELDGQGEAVGGIVIMRFKEDTPQVIERVKAKLKEIEPSLPKGVKVITVYDRSVLIQESIATASENLIEELIVVSVLIVGFLLHLRSALIPILTLPLAVLIAFIPIHFLGVGMNIMSIGGIIVAIGDMVDAAIIMVDNAHKRLEEWEEKNRAVELTELPVSTSLPQRGRTGGGELNKAAASFSDSPHPNLPPEGEGTGEASGGGRSPMLTPTEMQQRAAERNQVLIESAKEVGPAIFASLLVIAIAFMPVFTLEAQEGRLFQPLAWTKNLAIAMSALLAVTLIPALLPLLVRGRIRPERRHPVSLGLQRLYAPLLRLALRHRLKVVALSIGVSLAIVPLWQKLGSEFMPPLYEGTILYMPTTFPGISVTEAGRLLQQMDRTLKTFPEVEQVFGKSGRAETSTDPAPFSMMEVVVNLKPREQWRPGVSYESLVEEMDRALQLPGVTNAWTMPIKARVDMLTTGVRTPVGVKIFGPDLKTIEAIGKHIEMAAQSVPGTRSAYAERVSGGYFLDFAIKREAIARYGLTVMDVGRVIESAIGGESIATTVEGRERYPINIRYLREQRDDVDKLGRVLVSTPGGAQVPIAQLADLRMVSGPAMIRDEDGQLSGYVYVDMAGRDVGSYVDDLKRAVGEQVQLPPGYTLAWSGQYEFMQRVRERLTVFVPLTLAIIFVLFYFTFRSVAQTLMVMLGVPFALVGGIAYLAILGYNMSIAVWVGLIALAGVAAETSAVMLAYLNGAVKRRDAAARLNTLDDLIETIHAGAIERIRPMAMAGLANSLGLIPVMWASGAGSDVMKRLAAPMVGGVFSAMLLTLLVIPALYALVKERSLPARETHS